MLQLRDSWVRAWAGIGASTDAGETCDALVARYSENHRKYHTLQHLRECLYLFESVRVLASHPAEVELALWFHDAIYDIKRSDNEEQSADWAKAAVAQSGAPGEVAQRIHSLVMVTKHTGVAAEADEQLLVDIDLSILGATQDRFAEYEHQIREEYSYVPSWLFKRKRRAILRSFLDRPHIYGTPRLREMFEAAARANLRQAVGKGAR